MKVDVRFINAPRSDAALEFVTRHALFSLSRFARSIRRVLVRLEDVNGPGGGGQDKCCRIDIAGDFGQRFASAQGDDWFEVTARAFDAAQRGVTRAVVQQRQVARLPRNILSSRQRRHMA